MELDSFALERLADLVADRVAAKLRMHDSVLVDKHELAKRISLSVPTIERAVKAGTIPSVEGGRRRLFDVSEVIRAIKKNGKSLTPKREESADSDDSQV